MAQTETSPRRSQRALPLGLILLAVLLLAARVAHQVSRSSAETSGGLVRWVSLDRAAEIAAVTGKPLLIDFSADWCAPCHQLDAEVFQDPVLAAEINESFVPVRVIDRRREEGRNSPQVAALQQRYEVNGFPTVVFTHPNGTTRARMEGFRGRDGFVAAMERAR